MNRTRPSARPVVQSRERRPRLLIAGEFSAGKTRLINGLLGDTVLPSNVTATALPPVWLVGGGTAFLAVDAQGEAHKITSFDRIDLETTHYCVRSHHATRLATFDLIDTPGNSDPNMPSEAWERMLPMADAVVWCTNATQAWRQSEKAVWQDMPEHLRGNATLVITHADRLPDKHTADRLLRRVRREAGRYFSEILMASLMSDDDIARIAAHMTDLAANLGPLGGASDKLTTELAKQPRAETKDRAPRAPRRISCGDRTVAARLLRSGGSNVVALPPKPEAAEDHRARSLWASLSRDIDLTDVDAVLSGVETLIRTIDGQAGPADPPASATPAKASARE